MNKFEVVNNRKTTGDIILPKRKTKSSAGYDFYAPHNIVIPAQGTTKLYFTDIKVMLDDDCVLMLFPRSSLGIKGITIANTVGIIDADYYNNPDNEGNIGFVLKNNTQNRIEIKEGERFMQGVIVPFRMTVDDNTTEKRVGGYGSTN